MECAPVDILYEQGPCLVLCKPAGLLTQAPPSIDSLELRLKQYLQVRDDKPGGRYLGVPHRLDRPVTGAIVFARHVRACRRLSEQFAGRLVRKLYWACVAGVVTPPEGVWEDFLRKVPGEARAEVVPPDHPEGRAAVLRYRTLRLTASGCWLEIELETGRTHQIRIQAASRGYPVLGDAQYGSSVEFGPRHEDPRQRAIAMHARRLEFCHPMSREPVSVVAPLPDHWAPLQLAAQQPEAPPGNR